MQKYISGVHVFGNDQDTDKLHTLHILKYGLLSSQLVYPYKIYKILHLWLYVNTLNDIHYQFFKLHFQV